MGLDLGSFGPSRSTYGSASCKTNLGVPDVCYYQEEWKGRVLENGNFMFCGVLFIPLTSDQRSKHTRPEILLQDVGADGQQVVRAYGKLGQQWLSRFISNQAGSHLPTLAALYNTQSTNRNFLLAQSNASSSCSGSPASTVLHKTVLSRPPAFLAAAATASSLSIDRDIRTMCQPSEASFTAMERDRKGSPPIMIMERAMVVW